MIARNEEVGKRGALQKLLEGREAVSVEEISSCLRLDIPEVSDLLKDWVQDGLVRTLVPVGREREAMRSCADAVYVRWVGSPGRFAPHETWLQCWIDQVQRSRLGTMVNKLVPY